MNFKEGTIQAMETSQERKERIVRLTIENLLREVNEGPVVLSITTAEIDEFFRAAVEILENAQREAITSVSVYGVKVRRDGERVIIERELTQ